MSTPLSTKVSQILSKGPARSEIGRKQLTLAFGGLYLASTTAAAKPLLVWEEEKGYARYYIPEESLHSDIKGRLNGLLGSLGHDIDVAEVESVTGDDGKSRAVVERVTVGQKSTTWVRFLEGSLKGFLRFERTEIGWSSLAATFFWLCLVTCSSC
jgi:hypothetical protein